VSQSKPTHDKLPSYGRCPIVTGYGTVCGNSVPSQMPFDICGHHARRLWEYMNEFMSSVTDDPVFRAKLFLDRVKDEEDQRARENATRDYQVYYLQIGNHIKIGYSGNLKQRLKSYPVTRRLLAVEPGHGHVEFQRHRQFAHLLDAGNEWFRPGPDLIDHINRLRREAGVVEIPAPDAA
jgi:hypothetical protein